MKTQITCLALALGLVGLPRSASADLDVVATTPDLAALAKEIGGEKAKIFAMAKLTEDPHFVDPKPSFILKLNRADVLIEGGAELEGGWLPPLLVQARNRRVTEGGPGRVVANEGVRMLEVPAELDRAKGDLHAAGNPHYLMAPANALVVARHLAEVFTRLDPSAAEHYRTHLGRFTARLEEKTAEWRKKLAPFEGRQFVSYHNSWIYFAEAFGLKSGLYLEPKPGLPPTPGHLADVIAQMKRDKVSVILADPYINRRIAEKVADETGAVIVNVAQYPGAIRGTEGGYVELMDYLVNSVAVAMAGK